MPEEMSGLRRSRI